jgi:hypothetical protein
MEFTTQELKDLLYATRALLRQQQGVKIRKLTESELERIWDVSNKVYVEVDKRAFEQTPVTAE